MALETYINPAVSFFFFLPSCSFPPVSLKENINEKKHSKAPRLHGVKGPVPKPPSLTQPALNLLAYSSAEPFTVSARIHTSASSPPQKL